MNPVSLQLEQWSGILGTGKDLADERKETKLQSKRSVICNVVTQSKTKTCKCTSHHITVHKLLFLKAPSTTFTINIYIPIICVQSSSSTPTVGGMAWKYPFTYASLSWKRQTVVHFFITWWAHKLNWALNTPYTDFPLQANAATIWGWKALTGKESLY